MKKNRLFIFILLIIISFLNSCEKKDTCYRCNTHSSELNRSTNRDNNFEQQVDKINLLKI
jgi:peptidoglycan hydrolase CwlO-like protein